MSITYLEAIREAQSKRPSAKRLPWGAKKIGARFHGASWSMWWENDEFRMTNDESMTNDEARDGSRALAFCHSSFVIPSCFDIRHSSLPS